MDGLVGEEPEPDGKRQPPADDDWMPFPSRRRLRGGKHRRDVTEQPAPSTGEDTEAS